MRGDEILFFHDSIHVEVHELYELSEAIGDDELTHDDHTELELAVDHILLCIDRFMEPAHQKKVRAYSVARRYFRVLSARPELSPETIAVMVFDLMETVHNYTKKEINAAIDALKEVDGA